MKDIHHAENSAKKYGGKAEDYLEIHALMDSSKAHFPTNCHRAIFHNSYGIFIVEKIFGKYITNSEGIRVSVRDIAEDHCKEDFNGFIPTLQDFLENIEYQPWMNGNGIPPSLGRTLNKSTKSEKVSNWKEIVEEELKNGRIQIDSDDFVVDGANKYRTGI